MMNLLNKKPTPVDLDELEAKLHEAHEASDAYAPREPRERVYTPLQLIGHAITKLTYSDAVKMGEAIQAMLAKETGSTQNVTAAIQAWAKTWKDFADAIGPRE